jgi:catechol 2,3-dioxygenase
MQHPSGRARSRDSAEQNIHPDARIGHVHLKVSDLARAEHFYQDALGFEVTTRYGTDATFMSAGGYHHHIGLNVWESKAGRPAPAGSTGLYHFAILYPSRRELARAVRRVLERGVALDGAADHGVSEAAYLHDPDGNGIELYRDRDRAEWPVRADGSVEMFTRPLDLDDLLADAD